MLAGFKLHLACAAFAGGQHFGQLHMWFDLWSGYAVELLGGQVPDGRVGAEYYLHLVVKVNGEINVTEVAVRLGVYFAQVGMGFLGAAAHWAEQLPAQVKQSGLVEAQAELERLPPGRPPQVGQMIGPQSFTEEEHGIRGVGNVAEVVKRVYHGRGAEQAWRAKRHGALACYVLNQLGT